VNAKRILAAARDLSALVVGDICLDRWCEYDPELAEPSEETGIPRLAVVSYRSTAGAGGTVANNLAALGLRHVYVLGLAGSDAHGDELMKALSRAGVDSELMIRSNQVHTFTYTKLINARSGIEDQPRVDYVNVHEPPDDINRELAARLTRHAAEFDLILVSDQAETEAGGIVSARMRRALEHLAEQSPGKVIWVDSRRRLELFRGVTIKGNESEVRAACERIGAPDDLGALRRHTGAPFVFVTAGPRGASVIGDATQSAAAPTVETPVDICGAGDSFSAGAAVALAVTRDPVAAAEFGNLAASVTIRQSGTGLANAEWVLAAAR
jgi:rfaE bifunctional protein kinase chain/domain